MYFNHCTTVYPLYLYATYSTYLPTIQLSHCPRHFLYLNSSLLILYLITIYAVTSSALPALTLRRLSKCSLHLFIASSPDLSSPTNPWIVWLSPSP